MCGALTGWLDEAESSGVAEFESFAAGLWRDGEAVVAALSCEWSNGQTEEQVNQINQRLREDGYQVPSPARLHGSWTFYFQGPGGFTVEVLR